MTDFQLVAAVLVVTAAFAYVNAKFLRLPSSVGLMATALIGSVIVLVLEAGGVIEVGPQIHALVEQLDFGNTLLHGMLGLMLFAGALHIDVAELGTERAAVGVLAVGATVISTVLVGVGVHVAAGLPWLDALLVGALIAPTDPIAVLGMLKSARAPARLEVRIAGESLFNDGVGVVLFTVLIEGRDASLGGAIELFAREALGGAAFGWLTGYVLLRTIEDSSVEVLLTLALVIGGYAAAEVLGLSAPISAVVAGLVVGRVGGREHVDMFWKLIDEILNAVLFLMVGLVMVSVPVSWSVAGAAALAVPIALAARFLSVGATMFALPKFRAAVPHSIPILTWGGLRGGLSIAMALALPEGPVRDRILVMTYAVVAFSILIQGLTFRRMLGVFGLVEQERRDAD